MTSRAGVFLDRDGVINRPPPLEVRYVTHPDAFFLMPGIAEAIRHLNQAGVPVGVITNQKGIALGRYTVEGLNRVHDRMHALLAEAGAAIQDVRFCPHTEEDDCSCRKPLPGMLLEGAAALGVTLSESWMVGDQLRDLQAGRAAGCHTLAVGGDEAMRSFAEETVPDTAALPAWFSEHFPFQNRPELA